MKSLRHYTLFRHWRILVFGAILAALVVGSSLSRPSPSSSSAIVINKNWEYRWGDSPRDESGVPIWTYSDHASSDWISGENVTSGVFAARQPVLWLRLRLPEHTFYDPALNVREALFELSVYHDGMVVYSPKSENRFGFLRNHLIPLPPSSQGALFFFRITSTGKHIGLDETVLLVSQSAYFSRVVTQEIGPFIFGAIAVFLGMVAVAIFVGRLEQRLWFALSFGVFSASLGLFIIFEEATLLRQLWVDHAWFWYYGQGITFQLFPIGLFAFVEHILHGTSKRFVRRLWQGYILMTVGMVVLDLTGVFLLHNTPNFFIGLFGVAMICVAVLIARAARQGNADAGVLTIGFLLFTVLSIRDVAIAVDLLPDPGNRLYYWGMFLFLLCIGHILEYRFVLAEALRESEEQYRTLFENLQDMFYRTDSDGVVLLASPSVHQLLGYTEQNVVGVHLPQAILADPAQWTSMCERIQAEGRLEGFEVQLQRRDGTLMWGSANAQFYTDSEGRVAGIEGIIRDISARKQAEQELLTAHRDLQHTLNDLQQTQTQLIQSEKMAALGKLIANIAHEINTPIGAIRASADNIAGALRATIQHLPALLSQLSDTRRTDLFALVARASDEKEPLTSKEERQRRRRLQRELEDHDIVNADSVADTFIDMGVYGDTAVVLPLLRDPHCDAILKAAYELLIPLHHNTNILTAVDRASKIVFALKSYIAHNDSGAMVKIVVADTLDTVLSLYYNQLQQGIDVDREYADVPIIPAHPDQLGQVWTHLIHNAIQAMAGKGTLNIAISLYENTELPGSSGVLVQITDSGCGIPTDIQDRIFEPFFTTKSAGEGSGLGLDICRKIIEKHQGRIMVESQPGRTTFSVCLPLFQE